MDRAVERGLARREPEEIPWVGMDEKSFRSGHNYISVINDLENSRVLEVVEGREGNADNILTDFDSYITNAFSERVNSKIQAIKANVRGFRSSKNYRTRILFFCGKLSMIP